MDMDMDMMEEEEDTLSVEWQEEQGEIDVLLYGEVQQEILTERIRDRFGINVSFDEGTVVYRETLSGPAYGVGHFEPLRHYAEVHFLMEPMPRGTGILLESRLSTDELMKIGAEIGSDVMSCPSMTAVPEVGGRNPVIIRIVVDFPAPFGPRNPRTSPSLTEKETPFTAWKSPKLFFRFFTSSMAFLSVCL